ncbi:FecR domain-containing protein [Pseudanabaena yagii]|uniref:FecR domain-containing protein n=1 Tax=Pseudanabaena yagii GIHE-NHR1 TaxID=2722753 RepID=A0ABX1LVC0_9CYAN|nr:FecR domain-containing protein [Pseudanabaena yagii]NMF59311.1 FecR domain-containing protein [Pseudanabaena yagii GIHE-NHR1]
MPLLVLFLTATTLPSCTISQPAKPFSSEALPTEAIAEISEIRSYPVRVKYINSTTARPATVGVPLKVNESVSTDESSTAQITLRTGTIFRIGGTANLILRPQNQVEIESGKLVAWAAKDSKSPAQIKTSFGEISSNDGTLYLEIPAKAAEERRIISLDGTVTVLLKSTSEIVTLGKGEEIRIKADGKATAPKRIDKESIDKKIANNSLIFGFSTQLASLPQITSEFGVTATVKEASTIQFRRSDLPNKPDANKSKVTYTSGTANSDRRDEPVDRKRDDPSTNKPPEPVNTSKPTSEPSSAPNNAPTSTPTTPQPTPITTNPSPKPIEPAPQPAPLEPPPQPVQPEIPAPEPPPTTPKPKN